MLVRDLVRRKSPIVKNLWLRIVERKNIERASALHVTSRVEEEEARKFGYALPEIVCIPNGVGGAKEAVSSGKDRPDITATIAKRAPYLLFLGRINWKKGLDRLIPALAHVPGPTLLLAGNDDEGYWREIKTLAARMGLSDRVVYVGPRYGREKKDLLVSAAALVLPSYSENFGNVVLEAMAEGCPVVVTPEVGAAEIVHESGAGIVVSGKPEAFGGAVRSLLKDPARMREMGERGQEVVREKYTWGGVAARMEEAYEEILRSGAAIGGQAA
jgi:glycosyltransferase involved in cell wall biosynthesis